MTSEEMFPEHPHSVKIMDKAINPDMLVWLREYVRPGEWRYWRNHEFLFRNDTDAVAFKLAHG